MQAARKVHERQPHAALAEIVGIERDVKRRLAWAQRGLAAWLAADRSQTWLMVQMAAMRARMRAVLLESARTAYAAGWQVADRQVEAARPRFSGRARGSLAIRAFRGLPLMNFREGETLPVPEIPDAWLRWYETTLDTALHNYTEDVRRRIGDLVAQAAREGWTIPQLTEAIRPLLRSLHAWRAEMIARTETMRLWNLGHWGCFEQVEEIIGYAYSVVLDVRTSHLCRPLAGLKVRREELRYLPPLHPHCRTVLEPVYTFDDTPEADWGDAGAPAAIRGFGAVPRQSVAEIRANP